MIFRIFEIIVDSYKRGHLQNKPKTKMNPQLEDITKKLCKQENINDYNVEVHGGNKFGEGFLGEITFLTLTDNKAGKDYNLVIKKAFTNEKRRQMSMIRECFLNEINLYTNIFPAFDNLKKEFGGENSGFDKNLKCFLTSTKCKNEYLVLDNGKKLGYDLVSKKFILDSLHLELIFKNYAQFHSLSYVMQQKKPKVFEQWRNSVPNIFLKMFDNDESTKFIENIFEQAKKALLPEDDRTNIEPKLDKYIADWRDLFTESFCKDAKFKAIIHGDCWSNNMMFKYDTNGKPKELKLLDWQISNYGSPVCDLSYCLYSGSDMEHYKQLDRYLEVYYQAFEANLKELKYDFSRDPIPTIDDLKADWKRYCKFGFAMGLMLIRLKGLTEEELDEFSKYDLEDEIIQLDENVKDTKVNSRFRGLVLHMNEIGAL